MAVQRRAVLSRLGCLLLCFALEMDANTNDSCRFNGMTYRAGQVWYPSLKPADQRYCVRCTCSQEQGTRCSQHQCPPLTCERPIKLPNRCCMTCPSVPTSPRLQEPDNSSCLYNDTMYQHGDVFTNNELFPSRESNQCSQCSCSDGQIYCRLMTCQDLLCPSPQTIPDSCCQVCGDNSDEILRDRVELTRGVRHSLPQCSENTEETETLRLVEPPTGASLELFRPRERGGTTVRIILEENPKRSCSHLGKTYSHGEVWYPTVHLMGSMPCIQCTCKDGVHECTNLICPTVFPCEDPQKVQGKCCKVCPEDKEPPVEVINISKCRVTVYKFVPNPSSTRHRKHALSKIAVEREASEDVDIFIWKYMGGVFQLLEIKNLKTLEFRRQLQNYELQYKTIEGNWNMYMLQAPEEKATESPDKETRNL